MLECEWTNPGAMLLSPAEEGAAMDQPHHLRHPIFPFYDRGGLEFPCMFSQFPSPAPPPPATVVASPEDYSFHRYGLPLPPAAAVEPPAGPPMRIGLNLGVRTYFSSTPDGELMRLGSNVYRRSSGGAATAAATAGGGLFSTTSCDGGRCSAVRCQAEGCGADLARAKHYHRRHKVCEFHSKAAAAIVHGLTQRFCQQCSRFHVLSEFDQGKRSCRKRLAEHNRRRRKTHQPAASLPPPPPPQQPHHNTASAGNFAAGRKGLSPSPFRAPLASAVLVEGARLIRCMSWSGSSTEGAPPGKFVGVVAPPSPTRMALGRCLAQQDGFPGANSSTSSSPSSRSSSNSVLPHASDFRPYGHRLPISMWDADAEPEYATK